MDIHIHGKPAHTVYAILARTAAVSWVKNGELGEGHEVALFDRQPQLSKSKISIKQHQ